MGVAIESDESARTRLVTRDRERLQIEALEAAGWRTHQVRSLAWRLDPAREQGELEAAFGPESAVAVADTTEGSDETER